MCDATGCKNPIVYCEVYDLRYQSWSYLCYRCFVNDFFRYRDAMGRPTHGYVNLKPHERLFHSMMYLWYKYLYTIKNKSVNIYWIEDDKMQELWNNMEDEDWNKE